MRVEIHYNPNKNKIIFLEWRAWPYKVLVDSPSGIGKMLTNDECAKYLAKQDYQHVDTFEIIPKKPKFKDYWVCKECAAENGGHLPHDYYGTVTMGTCKQCDGKNQIGNVIIPHVDFVWEGQRFIYWD